MSGNKVYYAAQSSMEGVSRRVTRVKAGFRVTLSVTVDLSTSYKDDLNPHQLGDGQRDVVSQVLSTI